VNDELSRLTVMVARAIGVELGVLFLEQEVLRVDVFRLGIRILHMSGVLGEASEVFTNLLYLFSISYNAFCLSSYAWCQKTTLLGILSRKGRSCDGWWTGRWLMARLGSCYPGRVRTRFAARSVLRGSQQDVP
jgi:hypothetical protein